MSKRLFVGNLPFRATEDELRTFFEPMGAVHEVAIVTDRQTGRSRGFGFVEMDDEAADAAMAQLDGKEFNQRNIRISEARERRPR
ncbi:MAG: RNA-binding protein [Chitinivibrionales bacterium]|nr:RNA-binding protein [Chitinivibrionales bacterium]MBD3394810.1 RNA-binding protein [Chitinivibrionales bacterium]